MKLAGQLAHRFKQILYMLILGTEKEFLATDPEVPGSISGTSRFSEKQRVWNGVHSASWGQLRSYLKEKVAAPV
jgi:hypothetical protein